MAISEKLSSTILWIIAIVLVMGVSAFFNYRTTALQKKIDRADEIIAIMKLEHQAAIIASHDAALGRRQVYEQAKDKLCRAETAMGQNSVFCDMPIPDDLRLLWEKPDGHVASHNIHAAD